MINNQYRVGAILSYVSIFIGNLIGIIYTPIMLRLLGQSEYGLYSLVGSLIATISIVDLGFGNASIRYISKYRATGNKQKEYNLIGMFIIINSLIGILTIVIGIVMYKYLDILFSKSLSIDELQQFKLMFIILIFNLAVSFPFSVFYSITVSYEIFIFPKVIGIIRTILNPIVILALLFNGHDSLSMVIANTIINILFLWINVFYCFKYLNIKIKFKTLDFKLLKEITVYSFFIFLAILIDKIYWTTDSFILGIYSGTIMVSIYSIASQINMYYMQFSTALSGMFLPKVTGMVTNNANNEELSSLFIKVGRIQYILLGLVLSGLILFGKEFIYLWAGKEYLSAYYMAIILVVPFTIPLIQNLGLSILQAKNLHGFRSKVLFFIAIGNILISIPLAKEFGGIGSAIGTSVAMVIGNILIMNIYYYKKIKLDIPRFWYEIIIMTLPILFASILGVSLNLVIEDYKILTLLIKILIYTIIYLTFMFFLGMNNFEKELVIYQIKGISSRLRAKSSNLQKGI
jgi:O-antigen/teichoic acid export membrane protein